MRSDTDAFRHFWDPLSSLGTVRMCSHLNLSSLSLLLRFRRHDDGPPRPLTPTPGPQALWLQHGSPWPPARLLPNPPRNSPRCLGARHALAPTQPAPVPPPVVPPAPKPPPVPVSHRPSRGLVAPACLVAPTPGCRGLGLPGHPCFTLRARTLARARARRQCCLHALRRGAEFARRLSLPLLLGAPRSIPTAISSGRPRGVVTVDGLKNRTPPDRGAYGPPPLV